MTAPKPGEGGISDEVLAEMENCPDAGDLGSLIAVESHEKGTTTK